MAGTAALEIDDAELARLKRGIRAQLLDDRFRVGALLQFAKHQHLILMGVVDGGLARGDTLAGNDHRLHAHQELIVAIDAGGRRNHDTAGAAIDGNHRPGRRRASPAGREARAGTEPHDASRPPLEFVHAVADTQRAGRIRRGR